MDKCQDCNGTGMREKVTTTTARYGDTYTMGKCPDCFGTGIWPGHWIPAAFKRIAELNEKQDKLYEALDELFDAAGDDGDAEERVEFWSAVAKCQALSPKGIEYSKRTEAQRVDENE